MIVEISLKGGVAVSVKGNGHAGCGKAGENILCAAVSAFLRTFERVVSTKKEIKYDFSLPERGKFIFDLVSFPESEREWLRGITDYIAVGLGDLSSEYPEEIGIILKRLD